MGYLWRWMNWIPRLDVIVLALMLAYVVVVVVHVSYRCHLAGREREIDNASPVFQRTRRKLAADLSVNVGNVRSIAFTAPYLGLAGTCLGLLSVFRGFVMEKHAAMVMLTTYAATSLITTAAGLLVAVPAAWSYNYLRVRMDRLESEIWRIAQPESQHFRGAQTLPLTARFSKIPFAVIAAPGLAIIVLVWMPFFAPREPKGFGVELAPCWRGNVANDRTTLLHITSAGKLLLNAEQEEWSNLAGRLSEIYRVREQRTLDVMADDGVPFQTVANALDIVENVPATRGPQAAGMEMDKLEITVRLITPGVFNVRCSNPAMTGSRERSSR
ncbi:MAG: MotA/TolQ/ExbB proton channel family protein [Terriglobales bacterium]